jgi:hypothetical protein
MSYSLTNMSGLGTVQGVSSDKNSQLFQTPMPGSDSSDAFVLDIMGAARNIKVNGIFTGTEAECVTFIGQLDGLITGTQSSRTFTCDISKSYTVFVLDVHWEYHNGVVGKVDYSISLMEASG